MVVDVVSSVGDPLGAILSAGIGWLLEHVSFLREPLDALLGNPDEINGKVDQLKSAALEMKMIAREHRQDVSSMDDWTGGASDAFRVNMDQLAAEYGALGSTMDGTAAIYALSGALVCELRALVFETIADFISSLITPALIAAASAIVTCGASVATFAGWAAGGRLYLLSAPIATFLETGDVEEIDLPELPPVTDALRAEARRNPGGWVWCADPDVDPRHIEGPPNFALLGAYRADENGELTGETFRNDQYLPGPTRRGFPAPRTDFELVLNFVSAGWLPQERILSASLDADFILDTDGAGGLRVGVDEQGRRFLVVYSSPGYVPPTVTLPKQATGRGLLPALAGVTLIVNPGGTMGIELPGDDLIAAAG
ncbi:hypothetical protein [Alloactinosynnema sp. L-07]|nr:hypothetical protein [Alloactinosynnema sp. L-07]